MLKAKSTAKIVLKIKNTNVMEAIEKIHTYKLTYHDGDTHIVQIRMCNEEAQGYYLRVWEYWDDATQSEQMRRCVKCELLDISDSWE